jgi:hypothetical protein
MVGKLRRRSNFVGAVALGGKPRLARIELGEAFGDDGKIGLRHGLVEADEHLAFLHAIAVMDKELADHAAGRVLYLLHVRIDDNRALRDQRAGDFGGRGPAAQAENQGADEDTAGDDVPADRFSRAVRGPDFAECPGEPRADGFDALGDRAGQPIEPGVDFDDHPVDRGDHLVGHPPPPGSATFSARGAALACVTRVRISSFGPNCCWRPLAMIRI